MTVISVRQAAAILGLSGRRVRQLLEQGRLQGFLLTPRTWVVESPPVVMPHIRKRPAK